MKTYVKTGLILALMLCMGAGAAGPGYHVVKKIQLGGEGGWDYLTVVHESTPGKFEVAETVATQRGARTMAIDPKTHESAHSVLNFPVGMNE